MGEGRGSCIGGVGLLVFFNKDIFLVACWSWKDRSKLYIKYTIWNHAMLYLFIIYLIFYQHMLNW